MEECHKMLTDQVDWTNPKGDQYLRYGSKGRSPALLISKMKAASYPDFGLKLLMPKQIWIDDVHASLSRRKEVRSHMWILSVVRIKAYSRYGYDDLGKIVLRRADLQEHTIVGKDLKNLYPSDFEDPNLLLLHGYLDHLPSSDKWMLSTNATSSSMIIPLLSPRAVVFPVNNNERKIMLFNEIYKFSDGTLTRILEALAYRVKEFKIKQLNPGATPGIRSIENSTCRVGRRPDKSSRNTSGKSQVIGNTMKGASSKLNLVLDCTITDTKDSALTSRAHRSCNTTSRTLASITIEVICRILEIITQWKISGLAKSREKN
nr:hypothetical protein [Tanacetum cinerariifolium]